MKRYGLLFLLGVLVLSRPGWAQEVSAEAADENPAAEAESSFKATLKRMALEYTQNSVSNKDEDDDYPGTFNSDEQEVFTGVFDGQLEYANKNLVWLNSLFMEYGKTKATENGETTDSENADKILLTSDYIHKLWNLEEGVVGPFASLGYQTEFTTFTGADGKEYRTKILRGKAGVKLYDGKHFKDLYIAAVEEADFTYDDVNMKTGAEVGYEFEYQVRDDMTFYSNGFYRYFFVYDSYERTDYRYEYEINNRLAVDIAGGLAFAPFVDFHSAKSRGADKERSDTTVGIALEYKGDYVFW